MQKEKWIDGVMNSTLGIRPASLPADLTEKVMTKINNPEKDRVYSFPVKQWAAAAIVLVTLNVGSAIYAVGQSRKTSNQNKITPLVTDMQLESTYNY